jgi:hypothetical protein
MYSSLDARAPASSGRAPASQKRRHVARLGLAPIVLVAGLAAGPRGVRPHASPRTSQPRPSLLRS